MEKLKYLILGIVFLIPSHAFAAPFFSSDYISFFGDGGVLNDDGTTFGNFCGADVGDFIIIEGTMMNDGTYELLDESNCANPPGSAVLVFNNSFSFETVNGPTVTFEIDNTPTPGPDGKRAADYILEQIMFVLIPVLSGFFFMYWIFVWIVRLTRII